MEKTEYSEDYSLYIHIPYCISKCHYCDFYSKPHAKVSLEYIQAVLNEARYYASKYSIKGWKTVYIGGGTPSLMSQDQIALLLSGLKALVPMGFEGEVTMEMNPETVTAEKIKAFESNGGNRISLGVQSLNDNALNTVGRHCTRENALKGINLVKENFSGHLNLDIIAGLPGQTTQEFLKSLEETAAFNPDHLSLYTLTLEEGTLLYDLVEKGQVYWNEDTADDEWFAGREFLRSKGYCQYEVSNFAKKGFESAHNMNYWKCNQYIGCGSGAAGTVYQMHGGNFPGDLEGLTGLRWSNTSDTQKYMDFWLGSGFISEAATGTRHNLPEIPGNVREEEVLDNETLEFEFLMMGLRTLSGVESAEYKKRFPDLEPWFGDLNKRLNGNSGKWNKLIGEGKACIQEKEDGNCRYALTEEGLLFLDRFLTDL